MRAISSRTALCGILLHPAGHTRSPAMHNAAFAALGVDAVYLAFDVPPANLVSAVAGARALGLRQLSISLPHKVEVMACLDRLSEVARQIGAVNTVLLEGNELIGENTDWTGVVRALERETELAGKHAVVLGAGGTARAATYGLLARGAQVTVLNRSQERARTLAAALGANASGALDELARHPYDVLVNTTSVGMGGKGSPVPAASLRAGAVVLDAVYEPEQTPLLRDARARGARPVSGKWMLIEQAIEQIRLWTGKSPDSERMAQAFDQAAT